MDPGDRQVADKSLGDIQGVDKDQGWQQSTQAHNLLRYMMGGKGKD